MIRKLNIKRIFRNRLLISENISFVIYKTDIARNRCPELWRPNHFVWKHAYSWRISHNFSNPKYCIPSVYHLKICLIFKDTWKNCPTWNIMKSLKEFGKVYEVNLNANIAVTNWDCNSSEFSQFEQYKWESINWFKFNIYIIKRYVHMNRRWKTKQNF